MAKIRFNVAFSFFFFRLYTTQNNCLENIYIFLFPPPPLFNSVAKQKLF
jgi:hypothetical protein